MKEKESTELLPSSDILLLFASDLALHIYQQMVNRRYSKLG